MIIFLNHCQLTFVNFKCIVVTQFSLLIVYIFLFNTLKLNKTIWNNLELHRYIEDKN